MAKHTVIISILGDTRNFVKSVSRMSLKLAGMGAAVVAAAGAAGAGLFMMADEARRAQEKLEGIAKATNTFGTDMGAGIKRLNDFSAKLAMSTGVSDETISSVQGLILTFKSVGKTADQTGGIFDRSVTAALDLAAAGFGDAEGNAKQLGKALENPTKGMAALSRAGVTFTEAEKKKIRALQESGDLLAAQEVVLGAVEGQVKGLAESTATPFDKMKQALDELGEGLGKDLIPMVDKAATAFIEFLNNPEVKKWIEDLKTAMGALFERFMVAFNDPAVKESFQRLENGAKRFVDYLNSPKGKKAMQDFAQAGAASFNVLVTTLQWLLFTLDSAMKLINGDFAGMSQTFWQWQAQWFPKVNGDAEDAAPGTSTWSWDKSSRNMQKGGITVNFNAPVDSVSAGREIQRVLNDYTRANGGRAWA